MNTKFKKGKKTEGAVKFGIKMSGSGRGCHDTILQVACPSQGDGSVQWGVSLTKHTRCSLAREHMRGSGPEAFGGARLLQAPQKTHPIPIMRTARPLCEDNGVWQRAGQLKKGDSEEICGNPQGRKSHPGPLAEEDRVERWPLSTMGDATA